MPESPPYKPLLPMPGGMAVVGEGITSARREDASFLSLFQIPAEAPHGYDEPAPEAPRPSTEVDAVREPHVATPDSAEGVGGREVVGDMELLANDPFLGRAAGTCDVSLSQDARRTGLWGCTVGAM